jgi:peptidoglycan/LPS O-acetylase OafA/YrhL
MLIMNRLELRDRPRREDLIPSTQPKGYLEMFSLYRVIACIAVLGQHSFIWANMSGIFVGTGFITMLHLSRNSFFFLTGLVVCYAQITHPRPLLGFWRRRYWEIGVPYLAWTGIYLIFSLVTINASWHEAGVFLRHTLLLGFSQMYFIVVIFQFYLLFPLLLRLMRATRHHGRIMAASIAFAMIVGFAEHYPSRLVPVSHVLHSVNSILPMSRDFFSYQEFCVAGMLVALHLDQVLDFVSRRHRQILALTGVIGALTVLWYIVSVWSGETVEQASDIYEPTSVLWCFAAIAGIFSISLWWEQRTRRTPRSRSSSLPMYLAGLTGGVFFAHTLFINMIRSALDSTGLRASLPWGAIVAILFVGTVTVTFAFSTLIARTPLRWVLGGPVRAEQRASYNGANRALDDPPHPDSDDTISAIDLGRRATRR